MARRYTEQDLPVEGDSLSKMRGAELTRLYTSVESFLDAPLEFPLSTNRDLLLVDPKYLQVLKKASELQRALGHYV